MNNNFDFNIPLFYTKDICKLNENLKNDLEINKEHDYNLYKEIFDDKQLKNNIFFDKILSNYSTYYSYNKKVLKDNKYLIENFKDNNETFEIDSIQEVYNDIITINKTTNKDKNFINTYQYFDIFPMFEFLNTNVLFLQILTLYNIFNPLIALALPIFIIIIPFLLLKLQNIPISLSTYIDTLSTILKNHPISNFLKDYDNVGWDRKVFLVISLVFYFFNIYQNILSCIKFYRNFTKINYYLNIFKKFLNYSYNQINNINKFCNKSFILFVEKNNQIKNYINNIKNDIDTISFDNFNLFKLHNLGSKMKIFYELFKNPFYISTIEYCLCLDCFKNTIKCIQNKITTNKMNFCKINNKKTYLKNSYYCVIKENLVTNDINLDKNIIITGPNASGKTTLLKSVLFNLILSQQINCGFYKMCNLNPYKNFHSYINIPDTSQRDSLFQSEVRRCKDILDIINSNKERHFCIFDELYSGTNPNEAISCAYSYLKYLTTKNNCTFILTTHFTTLCEKLNNVDHISNCNMEIKENNKYTYKILKGISYFKGGIKVLQDLNYPDDIINDCKKIIKTINI